jgi:histidinol-phosphatase (PHP family)
MYDYHTHSSFSEDGDAPMENMIQKAISLGIKEYAVTDHYDPDFASELLEFTLDFPAYFTELLRVEKQYQSKIRLVKGIEIGIQRGAILQKCLRAAEAFPYDFILGSFHCAEGMDISEAAFFRGRSAEDAYRAFYRCVLEGLKEYKNYDVLGHINIIDRYTERIPAPDAYMDIVHEILGQLVADGKGLEINTSSFRYGMGDRTTPTGEMLEYYVRMGGEIVTTGSDAHRTADVGCRLDFAEEMIRRAGLKYRATFSKRRAAYSRL